MATHRKVEKSAGTGERSGSLDHFTFRVWIQYLLSADDFGVCSAMASKFRGENPVLEQETEKRVQAAIEAIVAARLVQTFMDGKSRYLYQPDWNTYQQFKYASKTALPPVPENLLVECCEKTRELFYKFHPKLCGKVLPHGNQDPSPNQDLNPNPEARPAAVPRRSVQGAGAFGAGTLPRDHVRHGYCGPGYRLCLNQWEFTELAKQFGGNDQAAARTAIEGFVDALVKALGDNQSPGGFKAIEQEFQVYLRRIGRLTAGPRLDAVAAVGETAHDQKIRDMRAGKFNG